MSSYGSASGLITVFESSAVKLSYQTGSSCSSGLELSRFSIVLIIRAVLNICVVLASGTNGGPNGYSVFSKIVAVGQVQIVVT